MTFVPFLICLLVVVLNMMGGAIHFWEARFCQMRGDKTNRTIHILLGSAMFILALTMMVVASEFIYQEVCQFN